MVLDLPELGEAVDKVLEAAWPRERRRAVRRMIRGILMRVSAYLLLLVAPGVALGMPAAFYLFMGGLAIACSRPEPEEWNALRHHARAHHDFVPAY